MTAQSIKNNQKGSKNYFGDKIILIYDKKLFRQAFGAFPNILIFFRKFRKFSTETGFRHVEIENAMSIFDTSLINNIYISDVSKILGFREM